MASERCPAGWAEAGAGSQVQDRTRHEPSPSATGMCLSGSWTWLPAPAPPCVKETKSDTIKIPMENKITKPTHHKICFSAFLNIVAVYVLTLICASSHAAEQKILTGEFQLGPDFLVRDEVPQGSPWPPSSSSSRTVVHIDAASTCNSSVNPSMD